MHERRKSPENNPQFLITTKTEFNAVIEDLSKKTGESPETIINRMLKIGAGALEFNIKQGCSRVHIDFEGNMFTRIHGFKNKGETSPETPSHKTP